MTTRMLIGETFDGGGPSPERLTPLFAPLSIYATAIAHEDDVAVGDSDRAAGADAEIRAALDALLDLHRRMEIEKKSVEERYRRETVRWLSGVVSGIAPRLSRALVCSVIEEIAARAFSDKPFGPITIRINPAIAAALHGSCPQLKMSPQILVREDEAQSEFAVLGEWPGGRLTFDSAEAIEKLGRLLAQSIENAELAE